MDENEFFREATLRICSSLEIEKALWRCYLYIRDYIPADSMGLHIYDPGLGVNETIAEATLSGGTAVSIKTPLPRKTREIIENNLIPRIRVVNRMSQDRWAWPIAKSLGAANASAVIMGLILEGEKLGVLSIGASGEKKMTQNHARLLAMLNEPIAIALSNSLRYRKLCEYKEMLAKDNRYLKGELHWLTQYKIIGAEHGLKNVMTLARQVAQTSSPVLLLGETGVGKEVIAHAIHDLSSRCKGPLVKVNCGAISQTLMDSELFGHERGAFTGAVKMKLGRFELADGGTIFLDEIGELTPEVQVRLLRVLHDREIERIGGINPFKVDIRVIAATHRNLEKMVAEGLFREDLYFRLKVFPIVIPPLRERLQDVPGLVYHFIRKKTRELGLLKSPSLANDALDRLTAYDWPGNVRELENTVERALILNQGQPLTFNDFKAPIHRKSRAPEANNAAEFMKLDMLMSRQITRALHLTGGRVEGKHGAAALLGINPGTLRKRMKKLGIPFGHKAERLYTVP